MIDLRKQTASTLMSYRAKSMHNLLNALPKLHNFLFQLLLLLDSIFVLCYLYYTNLSALGDSIEAEIFLDTMLFSF